MNTPHLTENEVQDVAIGIVDANHRQRLQHCAQCNTAVEQYRLLFVTMHAQPAPVFDFDVASIVIPKLPPPATTVNWQWIFIIITLALTTTGLLLAFYFLLPSVFAGISAVFTTLIIVTILGIAAVQSIDMMRSCQQKIKSLQYS